MPRMFFWYAFGMPSNTQYPIPNTQYPKKTAPIQGEDLCYRVLRGGCNLLASGIDWHYITDEVYEMSKKVGVSLSIPEETLNAIKTMAKNDHRTISAMVALILADAVKKEAQKSR